MSIFEMYIQEVYMTEAALFNKMKAVNKELRDKIDDKYSWYFIQLQQLGGATDIVKKTHIILYGFDKEPIHPKSEGIVNSTYNHKITHTLYDKTINGPYNKNDLDSELKRYTKYNTGAAYKK